MPPSGKLNTKG